MAKRASPKDQSTAPGDRGEVSPDDPSYVTYLAVRQAMNALRRLQDRYVEHQPASEIQSYVCAMLVRAQHPLAMGEIAKFLCLEPQTITGLISRMEAKGLVVRTRSEQDRRRVMVDVTEAGRAHFAHALRLTQTVRREAFSGMSLDEHVRLAGVMIGIRDMALTALGDEPGVVNTLIRDVFPERALAPFESQLPVSDKPARKRRRRSQPRGPADDGASATE